MTKKISRYFELTEEAQHLLMELKPQDSDKFCGLMAEKLRLSYITKSKLTELCDLHSESEAEIIKLYIPDPGHVMAGDFGEIFSFFLLKELKAEEDLALWGPYKWRWKEDRKKPAPKTDVVLFHQGASLKDDVIICAEAKMKSTKTKYSPITAAVEGAQKDHLSRLADTLVWFRERYKKAGNTNKTKRLSRFIDRAGKPSYKKKFHAIAILDSEFLKEDVASKLEKGEIGENLQIIFVGINQLKSSYERSFELLLLTQWLEEE